MTLRDLIHSVDAEDYAGHPLFLRLTDTKPEFGSARRIEVKQKDGNIFVSNAHVGSLGDILSYPIDVDANLNVSKVQLLDAILNEMSTHGMDDAEQTDFWNDMTNLQKEKIIK